MCMHTHIYRVCKNRKERTGNDRSSLTFLRRELSGLIVAILIRMKQDPHNIAIK